MGQIYPKWVTGPGAIGLLVLRVMIGTAFLFHGGGKIKDPLHWMDGMPGNHPPPILQAVAAVTEFGGGLALILGLLTPLAALGIAATMAVALATVHIPHGDPFVAHGGASAEPAAVYLAMMIMFLLVGPGTLSLDALLFRGHSAPA